MIKSYFVTAFRNLLRNKFYSAINIVGLTLGLAIGILILLWVHDELSYDRFNNNADHIFKVSSSVGSGSTKQVWDGAQAPLAEHALKEVPGIKNAVRVAPRGDNEFFKYDGKIFEAGEMLYTDASIFEVFDFKWIAGNIHNPFPDKQSVVLTKSTASAFFGKKDPIGKVLVADNNQTYTITGITEDCPQNSSIQFDMLFPITSISVWDAFLSQDWSRYIFKTYLELEPDISLNTIKENLKRVHLKHQPLAEKEGSYLLQPLTKIHLFDAEGASLGMRTVQTFFVVALLILLIASINYVNLSTARILFRFKEIGVRKIVGAGRSQLFFQSIVETLMLFLVVVALVLLFIYAIIPHFNTITGKTITFSLLNIDVWKIIGATLLFTMLVSCIYPAISLAKLKPIRSLQGNTGNGMNNNLFRKVLVVVQFMFSIGLITSMLIIEQQLSFIREKKLGYDKSYVISLPMHEIQDHFSTIKNQLISQSGILAVSSATSSMVNHELATTDTHWEGKDPNSTFLLHTMEIDRDFMEMFKLSVKGNSFTGTKADSAHFILNETAIREAGLINPIGKKFYLNHVEGTIIGVAKDFHFASLKEKINPLVFTYKPAGQQLFVKTTGKNTAAAISNLEKIWKKYNGEHLFRYSFLDEDYDQLYKSEQRTGWLFKIFSGIAVFISCIGLFGLSIYSSQARVKEIGIRKVLGATVSNITAMLSFGFLKLIMISMVVAFPISWFLMQRWLQDYAYRISIPWWIFAIAAVLSIFIASLTIGFQSIKAALTNPVKSLRNE
ncbi:ABC transporter permease [Olivibacter sp. SDN3]|uniref:ABC transporter permease n=1 Tax=Olivibacter sp. SDN3 TaxID=2764720 RepID=UPI0016512D17|nr:ABC transporter permease [Olivibacter sp. SDN3]QNL48122.1 ABC transporter permease [Olivibacter sp. SDN3]